MYVEIQKLPTLSVFWKKCVIISYMAVINFVITSLISQLIAKYVLVKYDDRRKWWLNITIFLTGLICVAISAYIVRNIATILPKPLKSESFDPNKVAENKTSVLTAFTYFLYLDENVQTYLNLFRVL